MVTRILHRLLLVACILVSAAAVPAASAAEKYYLIVFAWEANPNVARSAHTFATFFKVDDKKGAKEGAGAIEARTISWMPASLDIRLLAPPEKGVNLELSQALKHAKTINTTVSAWGPFEIQKELFDRAGEQAKRLSTGAVLFKAWGVLAKPADAINCIQAVSGVADGPLLDTGKAFGTAASRAVLQHLSRYIIEPRTVHREFTKGLGLDAYPITYLDEAPAVTQKPK